MLVLFQLRKIRAAFLTKVSLYCENLPLLNIVDNILHIYCNYPIYITSYIVPEYVHFSTFAAKHDCSKIYHSLPNATTVEIYRRS